MLNARAPKSSLKLSVLDDGSERDFKYYNKSVKDLPHVVYEELSTNLGRSKIRNELGKRAKFDLLIFMDCDSKVVSESYIKNYLDSIEFLQKLKAFKKGKSKISVAQSLIYGGRCYQRSRPKLSRNHFHWHYGIKREQSTALSRKKQPYHSFMTNNFLIPKHIFLDILFDENLTQYGHEDTLFGLELKKREIPIIHIDNPLEHIGLETTKVFIEKSKKAIQNLYYLSQRNELIETKLLSYFKKLKRFGLVNLMAGFFDIYELKLLNNFQSKSPNLKLFDLYKLGYLCKISMKNPRKSV